MLACVPKPFPAFRWRSPHHLSAGLVLMSTPVLQCRSQSRSQWLLKSATALFLTKQHERVAVQAKIDELSPQFAPLGWTKGSRRQVIIPREITEVAGKTSVYLYYHCGCLGKALTLTRSSTCGPWRSRKTLETETQKQPWQQSCQRRCGPSLHPHHFIWVNKVDDEMQAEKSWRSDVVCSKGNCMI